MLEICLRSIKKEPKIEKLLLNAIGAIQQKLW